MQNDKEYLKYVRIQMWWNFIARFLLGVYEVILAFMIIFAEDFHRITFIHFKFECEQNILNHNWNIIKP